MENMKIKRSFEENKVFASLKMDVYIALGGMVIPSLRCVAIDWQPGQMKAFLSFFHDGNTSEPINWHYSCIEAEATSMEQPFYYDKRIIMRMGQVVSSCYPLPIPDVSEIVYLGKEPLTDFNEIDFFVPNWAVGSIIRLKVNEALRGKVTKDLRQIHLTWNETKTEALITFYHNQEITEDIQRHYQEIFEIATATAAQWKNNEKPVIVKLAVKYVPYPNEIEKPKNLSRLYSRKEPFTDKPIGEE